MVTESKELTIRQDSEVFALPDEQTFRTQLTAIRRFQTVARELMVSGHDYGIIPGTNKPTLLKPGAEKICKILGLAEDYEIVDRQEDWNRPFFRYLIRCKLISMQTGSLVASGLGECNSMESKYRFRWVFQSQLPQEYQGEFGKPQRERLPFRTIKTKNGMSKQYQVANEDIYSQVNTILKMAKKRAHIDASLSAGRLSEVFTQDIEDIVPDAIVEDLHEDKQPEPKPNGNGKAKVASKSEYPDDLFK